MNLIKTKYYRNYKMVFRMLFNYWCHSMKCKYYFFIMANSLVFGCFFFCVCPRMDMCCLHASQNKNSLLFLLFRSLEINLFYYVRTFPFGCTFKALKLVFFCTFWHTLFTQHFNTYANLIFSLFKLNEFYYQKWFN